MSTSTLACLGLVATLAACNGSPVANGDTGLMGQVFRGPIAPVSRAGESNIAPLRALFHILRRGNEVAQFESDDEGRFRIALPPGDYVVVPDASAPLLQPTLQEREVSVPDDGYTEVVLEFDTGIR